MSALRPLPASSVIAAEAPSGIGWQALGPAIACTILAVIVVTLTVYSIISDKETETGGLPHNCCSGCFPGC